MYSDSFDEDDDAPYGMASLFLSFEKSPTLKTNKFRPLLVSGWLKNYIHTRKHEKT